MDFHGGAWDGSDAQDFQGIAGCDLLALFDGAARARGHFFGLDGDPGGEARPVGRALLGNHAVDGPQAVRLKCLLQERLPIAQLVGVYLGGVEDLVYHTQYEGPVDKIRRPDYGLDRVGDDRVVHDGALDDLLYALAPAHGGQKRLPDEVRPDTGEIPFQKLGVTVEDELGHAVVQDGIAEKLQPAVRFVGISDAGVRKRALPQWFRKDRYEVPYRHLVLYSTLVNAITTL